MKAAIYCRLSEEDRNKANETDDSNSIQNQKTMLIQYAFEHGWEVYNIYSDDDYTGADRKRPEFQRLLADAEARKFDIILCKTQSRFTRELELVEKYIHGLFPLWGIRFISIVDNADTDNKGNKKSRQINGLVNEWYLEDMSENIKSVLTSRREGGFHIGSFALYGYKKDPDSKGHLIIDEEAANVVREIFNLFARGYGKSEICKILNDRGEPNPLGYKQQHGLNYKNALDHSGTLWRYYAISNILSNEMYIGNMVQGKIESTSYKTKKLRPRPKEKWIRVEGTHDPIIDIELWNRVQELLQERAKPFSSGQIGLFARKVRCGYCNYTMRSQACRSSKDAPYRRYLKCNSKHLSGDACTGSFIRVDKLERYVIEELHRLSAKYLDMDLLESAVEIDNGLEAQKDALNKELTVYRRKSEEFGRGIKELYMDKVKGVITETEYIEMSGDFREEKLRMDALVSETKTKIEAVEKKIDLHESKRQIVEKYANVEKLTREMVDELIDYILVFRRIEGTQDVPIEIHWNF